MQETDYTVYTVFSNILLRMYVCRCEFQSIDLREE